jgi:preprotein translocase subunit Sss1
MRSVKRLTKAEEILSTIVGLAFIGGIGFGVYWIIKKLKQLKSTKNLDII